MNQVLLLLGLALGAGTSQRASRAVLAREALRTPILAPASAADTGLPSEAARPAAAQNTVHRATGATPQAACGRANTAASARAKRLGTCVLKLAMPESCKFANGLYTAEAVSADAKCYPAHPTHKPPVLQ